MTVIVDYGVGNLFSLSASFAAIGEEVCVSSSREVIGNAERIVLPGANCAKADWTRSSSVPPARERRFWAFVWECNFYLKRVLSMASTKGSG